MLTNYALKDMEKSLYGQRLAESLGLARGTKSITDLPEFAPAAATIRNQGALSLQDIAKSLLESGTSGPAAGLALEKAGTGIDNAVLQLPGQLLASREGDPWKAYDNTLKRRQQNMNYALAQQQQEGGGLMQNIEPILGVLGKMIAGWGKPAGAAGAADPLSGALASSWGGLPPELLAMLAI